MLVRAVRSWIALAAICGILFMLPVKADGESHNIPSHLLECYQNQTLYHRQNRLPATMPVFVSLLKQIEEYPGFTMDARSFALSLIHMFRVDGIERDPEVIASEYTIPFGLTGQQYFRHSVLVKKLLPQSSFLFPNASLSDVQKCSLHFMLSNSLDKVQRGDESKTCNSISSYTAQSSGRYRRAANFDGDEDEDIFSQDPVVHDDDIATATSDDDLEAQPAKEEHPSLLDSEVAATDAPANNGEAPVAAAAAPRAAAAPNQQDQLVADAPAHSMDDPDAEIVVQPGEPGALGNDSGAAAKKGNLMWGADGAGPVSSGQMRASSGVGVGRLVYPQSDCPVENGVVYTPWGSVQLGTLLAGIAAGFETQLVAVKDINAGSRTISGLSDSIVIDNRYAATLAGDMAEVALIRGPRNTVKVGASGNWNTTDAQQWYFIKEANEMTDAEIRGGLDGLIIAHHVKDWANKAEGALRLSTILERYYSKRGVFDEQYRACERQNHYKDVATSDVLKEQTTSFASALYDATPSTPMITSTGLSGFAADAVEALDKTVRASSQMETNCATSTRPDTSTTILTQPKLNLIFVVDCQWSYDYIKPVLQSLAEKINLHPYGSNITVLGAATHEFLFNTSDRTSVFSENLIKNETQYRQCAQGMKLNDLLENYLWNYFTNQLDNEKANKESSVRSNVVVLMPYENYNIQASELREVENRLNDYRRYFPDVMFFFFTSSRKDSYKILVEDYDTDIIEFSYSSGKSIDTWDLVNRLKTVPRRIANPTCGNSWKQSKYEAVRIYETIPYKYTAYYRIHPKYLFGIGSEAIKIREQNKGTVTICYSRTNAAPQNDDDDDDSDEKNDSQCESISGSEVEIKLSNPCSGSNSYQTCNPLYISIEVTETKFKCGEITTCSGPDDGAVEIVHDNLTCGVSALSSPITLGVAVFLIISKILVTG